VGGVLHNLRLEHDPSVDPIETKAAAYGHEHGHDWLSVQSAAAVYDRVHNSLT
jgi:hypothetical protein